MPHANARSKRRTHVAQIEMDPLDHQRLLMVAAWGERSAAAEIRFAIRQRLAEFFPADYAAPAAAATSVPADA